MGRSIHAKGIEMPSRNIVARIERLETSRRRPDEILLVWRKPDSDVTAAVATAKIAVGDKVICAEWFGDGPMPCPHWYGKRLSSELGSTEYEYIIRSLHRLIEAEPQREPGFAPIPAVPDHRIAEFSDNDLLHICLGVET
jgi:hypothetical protein